jgi:hypothetical protein
MLSYKNILAGADQSSKPAVAPAAQPQKKAQAQPRKNGSVPALSNAPGGNSSKSKKKGAENNNKSENVVKFATDPLVSGGRPMSFSKMHSAKRSEVFHSKLAQQYQNDARALGGPIDGGALMGGSQAYSDQYQHSHYTSTAYPSQFQSHNMYQPSVNGGPKGNLGNGSNNNHKKSKGNNKGGGGKDSFVLLLDDVDDEVCKVAAMEAYGLQRATYASMDPELENHLLYIYYCHGLVITEHARLTGVCLEISRKKAIEDWLKTRSPEEQERYLSGYKRESPSSISAASVTAPSLEASPSQTGADSVVGAATGGGRAAASERPP